VTKEEVVQNLRRQSKGYQRTSSQFRGVTRHQKGKWEARIGQMVGKKYKCARPAHIPSSHLPCAARGHTRTAGLFSPALCTHACFVHVWYMKACAVVAMQSLM
jgi:hypothetical protein